MLHNLLKCFCVPDTISLISTIILFGFLYLLFFSLLLIFRKVFPEGWFSRRIVESLRRPVFTLLILITLLFVLNLFVESAKLKISLHHFLVLCIIATLGWAVAAIVKTSFSHFMTRLERESVSDLSARSALTQVIFLYRFIMFVIFLVTAAAILVSFPYVRAFGIGLLSSAGIVGIALGIAARPIFLNIMAGFQIAMTKTIKIGDAVFLEGDFCRIEGIHLTHVIARTWDLRRLIVPISYFIDKTFQNWDIMGPELIASCLFYCDYRMPVEEFRKKTMSLLKETPLWNGKTAKVEVFDSSENAMQIRVLASSDNASSASDLKGYLREKLLDFLQKEFPDMLPHVRQREYPEKQT